MTAEKSRNDLLRMMGEACDARASFRVWRTLDLSKSEKARLSAMNDLTYVDFFHVVRWGTQTLAFLSLGKIFDQSRGALNLRGVVRNLHNHELIKHELIKDVDRLCNERGAVIEKIKRIRNKSVAHNDENMDQRSLFDEVGITPNEMESLIDDVCRVLNDVYKVLNEAERRESFRKPIPDDVRFKQAVHELLDKLGNA